MSAGLHVQAVCEYRWVIRLCKNGTRGNFYFIVKSPISTTINFKLKTNAKGQAELLGTFSKYRWKGWFERLACDWSFTSKQIDFA